MHLSGRPLAKPYRTRAFFLRIFLPACKSWSFWGISHFNLNSGFSDMELVNTGRRVQKSVAAQGLSPFPKLPSPTTADTEMPSANKTRNQLYLTVPWVRIPLAPPSRACNQADYRLFPFFRNEQFRALSLFRRENHPFSPTSIDPHRLPKSPPSGRASPVSIACAEVILDL